ncbi:hypothetical protein Aave_0096 [Paracidovorax citrulli AAC00-1]|uniref:Uncharacterized protein n=1 Tax=Paracidovorax citrulli (strain AAC00-1) TaxID=397945 RepID=A1TIC1_PARC0|nr:hypothetical protein Aave_0096 [Paracidovorax citrulli AAC00-1]
MFPRQPAALDRFIDVRQEPRLFRVVRQQADTVAHGGQQRAKFLPRLAVDRGDTTLHGHDNLVRRGVRTDVEQRMDRLDGVHGVSGGERNSLLERRPASPAQRGPVAPGQQVRYLLLHIFGQIAEPPGCAPGIATGADGPFPPILYG